MFGGLARDKGNQTVSNIGGQGWIWCARLGLLVELRSRHIAAGAHQTLGTELDQPRATRTCSGFGRIAHGGGARQLETGTGAWADEPYRATEVKNRKQIVSVFACSGYVLEVVFGDGTRGQVDLSLRFFGTMFEPLRDTRLFSQVYLDKFGAVCWPNGADLAPDALYRAITSIADASAVLTP